jgi:hypothetical protein
VRIEVVRAGDLTEFVDRFFGTGAAAFATTVASGCTLELLPGAIATGAGVAPDEPDAETDWVEC